MTVSGRALPVDDDAGALVLRYQQRIRAELLKKAAEEATWAPRWGRGGVSLSGGRRVGAQTLGERMGSVIHAFSDQRQFVTSGLMLALVSVATSAALFLGSPGAVSWIGLMMLAVIVVLGVTRPVRYAAIGATAVAALGQLALVILDGPGSLLPGLVGSIGLIGTGLLADRYGLTCQKELAERDQDKRLINEMQPVDEQAGVLKWAHASLVFDRELARAHRYGHPLTVLRVKVERWDIAQVNLGPEKVGEVLAEVGALLVSSSRVVDVVAYHGDAKFDLLLPDTADLGAVVVARRISAHTPAHEGVKLRVGVAPVVGKDGSIDDLLQQGDDAAELAAKIDRPFAIYGVETNVAPPPSRPEPVKARRA
jgi:diguanylate cyclase (GGDEF)-like protein